MPIFTIGWGSSGGAIQQHQIADNYPGLLDGLITGRSFADTAFASSTSSGDSRLLLNYFDKLAGAVTYTDEQKRAIAGFANVDDDLQPLARAGAALQRDRALPGRAARGAALRPGEESEGRPLHDLGSRRQRVRA